MPDSLVIVESPAKAKTIGKYLGKKYMVKASMGHVIDLPKSQMGVDIEHGFKPKYITIRGKGDILKELREASRKVKRVYLAADPDREGEAIAWHLAQSLDVGLDQSCRVVFNEITQQAVKDAFKRPRKIDLNLVNAQQARRVLDRLVGYKISPLLWKKVKKGLSAGRVQSVAVKMILDREDEINRFIPEEYWSITARLAVMGQEFEAKFFGDSKGKIELKTEAEVNRILEATQGKAYQVIEVRQSERKRNPASPFTTSSLQQEASRKLKFRAAKTMSIAQQLYEGIDLKGEGTVGLITYMRTDSTRVSDVAKNEAKQFIAERFGDAYLPVKDRVQKQREQAQDAHEAVRPTSVFRHPDALKGQLSRDQYRLYKLIWERFVASQMHPAVLDTMSVDIQVDRYIYRASGSKIKFPGFMKLYVESSDDAVEDEERYLPALEKGMTPDLRRLDPQQHFTQPPPRYTEASLVKAMEENGIGRPSTYAPTLETIQKRGYVLLEERRFVPTELGRLVIELIDEFFTKILDVDFTANLEEQLDRIEEGKTDWIKVIDEFYRPFAEQLSVAEKEMKEVTIKDEVSDEVCEKCGKPMVYKLGRYGKFLACSGFPDCRNTKPIVKELGVNCPKCGGQIVERKSKRNRLFYGCSRYPECDFVSWDKPVLRPCPSCGHLMVEKKGKGKVVTKCTECQYEEEM